MVFNKMIRRNALIPSWLRWLLMLTVIYIAFYITFVQGYSAETYHRLAEFNSTLARNPSLIKKASDVLGDDWDQLCLVDKHSAIEQIEIAIKRKLNLIEKIKWLYIAEVPAYSESTIMLYEKNGYFFRMEPPLSQYIKAGDISIMLSDKHVECVKKEGLLIRKTSVEHGYALQLFYLN